MSERLFRVEDVRTGPPQSYAQLAPATANPDGSDYAVLNSALPFVLFCLFWSRNGLRFICHIESMANPDDVGLYGVRSSDGDLERVTATPVDCSSGAPCGYAADGSRILWARFHNPVDGTLYSSNADASGQLRLTPPGLRLVDPGFFDPVGASWSLEGFAGNVCRHLEVVTGAPDRDLRRQG